MFFPSIHFLLHNRTFQLANSLKRKLLAQLTRNKLKAYKCLLRWIYNKRIYKKFRKYRRSWRLILCKNNFRPNKLKLDRQITVIPKNQGEVNINKLRHNKIWMEIGGKISYNLLKHLMSSSASNLRKLETFCYSKNILNLKNSEKMCQKKKVLWTFIRFKD